MEKKSGGEFIGLIFFLGAGVVLFGLWSAGREGWRAISGNSGGRRTHVRCHVGGNVLYEGVAMDGVREAGSRLVLTDPEGREVTIDRAAVCVTAKIGRPAAP